MPPRAVIAKAAAKVAEATVRRLVLGLVAAGAVLPGPRRFGLARRGVLARETRPLVGDPPAVRGELGRLDQVAGHHERRAAALQVAHLEVKCGNLLVKLSDHLRAGIDLIRDGHGHAALGIGGRGGGGHGHAAALGQRAPVPALDSSALGLLDAAALTLELRDFPLQLLEGGALLLQLCAKDPQTGVAVAYLFIQLDAIGVPD